MVVGDFAERKGLECVEESVARGAGVGYAVAETHVGR